MKIPIIDPHLHLFARNKGHYDWLKKDQPPFWPDKHLLQNDFSEKDILDWPSLDVRGFVHIEAGFDNDKPWREIEWLESSCTKPMRTIAFLDLTQAPSNFIIALQKLMDFVSFVGVRHIVDQNFINLANAKNIIHNLRNLAQHDLLFELQAVLGDSSQFSVICKYLSEAPDLKVSVNHAGFADFTERKNYAYWCENLNILADKPNCCVKVSGFEMIERRYANANIKTVLGQCIESFGQKRVMLASNFPLTTLSCNYEVYWQRCINVADELGLTIEDLTLHNAQRFYGFSD